MQATVGTTTLSRVELALLGSLLLGAAALYWPVRSFEFLNLDDDRFVTANPMVRQGASLEFARWAFTTTEQGHYQPLTWLSHGLDVTMFGVDARGHHTTNLLLFLLTVALCFFAFREVVGRFDVAYLTTALFAFHPQRIEVVAWVADRKDLVSAVFFFVALWTWATGRRRIAWGVYLLALLAKPTVLPLPILWVLLDLWSPKSPRATEEEPAATRFGSALRVNAIPLVLMLAYTAVPLLAQRSAGAVRGDLSIGRGAAHLLSYAGRFVWPTGISIFHPLRELPPGLGVASALIVVGVAALGLHRLVKRRSDWAFALLWAIALLLPVCGLVQIGSQSVADRWMLLPSTGLAAGLLMVIPSGLRRPLAAVAAIALLALTHAQLPTFRSSEAVFGRALELAPDNLMAHLNLGVIDELAGRLESAGQHYELASQLNPRSALPLNNLGSIEARRGHDDLAFEYFARAAAADPSYGPARYNLARALLTRGRVDEAASHYAAASRLQPLDAMTFLGHGAALLRRGELAAATEALQRSVSLNPGDAQAWAYLARAHRMRGDTSAARTSLQQALSLNPADPVALDESQMIR